jgi:hypothetical protein
MRLLSIIAAFATSCGVVPAARAPAPAPPPPAAGIDDPYFWPAGDTRDPGDWIEIWREPFTVGRQTLTLVGQEWPGDGQSIVVERDGHSVGAYRFDFGGLGGTLTITRRCATPDWALLEIRAEGTTKGYWRSPGQEKCPAEDAGSSAGDDEDLDHNPCYVGPSTDATYVELAIDARHAWLAGEADHPSSRACYPAAPR